MRSLIRMRMFRLLRVGFIVFFLIAGLNHFLNPDMYLGLIPDYLPFPEFLNYASGAIEVLIGILAIPHKTRKISGYMAMALMLLFIPSHVYFIEIGSCIPSGLCVPEWVSYLRLLLIHPLLIAWAWAVKTEYYRVLEAKQA